MPRLRRPPVSARLLRQGLALALLVTAAVWGLQTGSAPPAEPGPATVPVVVAADDLPAGATLEDGGLAVVRLPAGTRPSGAFRDVGPLAGRVLAAPVRAGEPLTDVRLVGSGVTALLPADQVAAPVRLADLAVAGLVRGGDRIDVLATVEGSVTAEVVAAGALVLSAPGSGAGAVDGSSAAGLLLVAVEPGVAARLAAAATSATLTLVLPPP